MTYVYIFNGKILEKVPSSPVLCERCSVPCAVFSISWETPGECVNSGPRSGSEHPRHKHVLHGVRKACFVQPSMVRVLLFSLSGPPGNRQINALASFTPTALTFHLQGRAVKTQNTLRHLLKTKTSPSVWFSASRERSHKLIAANEWDKTTPGNIAV